MMQPHPLLSIDREQIQPFFERVPELFEVYHGHESQDPEGYHELLYRIYRPYTNQMFDMIDEWMGFGQRSWHSDVGREVVLMLYAIRYPDTLLLESLSEEAFLDIRRISGYLHFMKHTYSIWNEDTRRGLARLGINIPSTDKADPFIYGAYISAIELLKELAPFYSFMEHDVPRQRLFQAALAGYGMEE